MSQHFYDGQIKRYITQFMRLMSNFAYKDAKGVLTQVPVRYGDATRQVAAIINKNSENVIPNAPFISCYIKDLKFDRPRTQDPSFVSKLHIRERAYDEAGNEYLNTQGANYTVERIMPVPYVITFNADIWTSNTDQKFQLWEQIAVLFNPSMELQTTDNYIDWTSLSVLELTDGSVFDSRTIPQGVANDISIATLQFTSPIWITPPAKIKKLGIITKIISKVFAEPTGTGEAGGYDDALFGGDIFNGLEPAARIVITPGDYSLLLLNNTAVLVPANNTNIGDGWIDVDNVQDRPSWLNLLDQYPGQFTPGLSQLRVTKSDGTELVAYISLNPTNESLMALNIDRETMPANTLLSDITSAHTRGTIDAIINPQTFNPGSQSGQNIDRRYLILEDINIVPQYGDLGYDGPDAWKNIDGTDFQAHANDIIQWDGLQWNVLFDSTQPYDDTYITNAYTGVQYKWDGEQWSKSFEGVYDRSNWRLIL
jgi:hypothetical protein